jgi:hypothetical protein
MRYPTLGALLKRAIRQIPNQFVIFGEQMVWMLATGSEDRSKRTAPQPGAPFVHSG